MRSFLIFLVLWNTSTTSWSQRFVDHTEAAGIQHFFEVYEGMFGGGVAVLDFNNDGFEDLYLTGGMQEDQLLENQKDGTFKNVFHQAGLTSALGFVTQGVATADFNRDGWMDLFITTITTKGEKKSIPRAQNLIFINKKDGAFEEQSKSFGISKSESFSTGIAIGDINLDGYPDVYVGNYFTDYDGGLKEISDATIVNAGKTAKGYLYENKGGKKFEEVSKKYNLSHRGFSFGGIFTDFDNDHDMDLIINNDFGYKAKPNYLLQNQFPEKKFSYVEEARKMDLRINAMGGATADLNADSYLDYFITNIRFNRFMIQYPEENIFIDQAETLGTQLFTISWGANFTDFDQDGDMDYVAGNFGLNSQLKTSIDEPVSIVAKDFDKNGSIDPILSCYYEGRNYPVFSKDDIQQQLSFLKKRFVKYKDYADEKKTYYILPNGKARIPSKGLFLRSDEILPGSTIIVPRQARPLSGFSLVEAISPVLASLSITLASINSITNTNN